MKLFKITFKLTFALLLLFSCSTAAPAQSVFFIASYGNDANACTRTAPCRSMQAGVNATPDGGELQVLDSGGYGPNVSITKSITISANGVRATIATPSGTGISVNAPGEVVVIRGLLLIGFGTGLNGIAVNQANAVFIEQCEIEQFGTGIEISSTGTKVSIQHTVSRNSTSEGLEVTSLAETLLLVVDNCQFLNSGAQGVLMTPGTASELSITNTISAGNGSQGFVIGTGVRVMMANTTAAHNGLEGFRVQDVSVMSLERCVARGNSTAGISAQFGAVVRVSNSISTDNATGFENNLGTFESRGNNLVRGNTTDTSGDPITIIAGI